LLISRHLLISRRLLHPRRLLHSRRSLDARRRRGARSLRAPLRMFWGPAILRVMIGVRLTAMPLCERWRGREGGRCKGERWKADEREVHTPWSFELVRSRGRAPGKIHGRCQGARADLRQKLTLF